ncbi:MAG: hypothetical protein QM520_04075 [Gammaproteobacteria bacterium]|nr:hypothetical protein [Gammaproteobacteria bacterium]
MTLPPPPPILEFLAHLSNQSPIWLKSEVQNRVILMCNHLLNQEPLARQRLVAHTGKTVTLKWDPWALKLKISPIGLFTEHEEVSADLTLSLEETNVLEISRLLAKKQALPWKINGDVQLAAELAWLQNHLRWDIEADLAHWLGDKNAYLIMQALDFLGNCIRKIMR